MKTYKAQRKINLGRYGLQYEALDIGVEGCATRAEATQELNDWRAEIHAGGCEEAHLGPVDGAQQRSGDEGTGRQKRLRARERRRRADGRVHEGQDQALHRGRQAAGAGEQIAEVFGFEMREALDKAGAEPLTGAPFRKECCADNKT